LRTSLASLYYHMVLTAVGLAMDVGGITIPIANEGGEKEAVT